MSIPCITNDYPGWRKPCLQNGEHLSTCDGRKRNGAECKKCLPRPAEHGLLCWNCWERLVLALTRWPEFAATILPLGRVMMQETAGVRTASAGHVGLTATMLTVNEVESYMLTLTKVGANADLWVSSVVGASDAIQFLKAAEQAFKTHPLEEAAHKTRVRCVKCGQKSLDWNPPTQAGKPVTITCRNVECQTIFDQDEFEQMELSA
jgi:hypothetical protein